MDKLIPGHRYKIRYKRDSDRREKYAVLDFMMEFEREYLFSARPTFGTQTIPKRWVRGIVEVDKVVPIHVS